MSRNVHWNGYALLIVTVLTAGPVAAETAAAGVGQVTVPVVVLKDGQPVRGLSADDFEIREQGKRAAIADFQEVDLDALEARGGAEAVPDAARRHILLLFDLSFSRPASLERARRAAQSLTAEGLRPSDVVAIVIHDDSDGSSLVLAPTSDHQQISEAIAVVGRDEPVQAERGSAPSPTQAKEVGPIVNADDLILARARDSEVEKGIVQQEQGHILKLIRSLSSLAALLRPVPGRTQVVLFSEGFDSSVILGNLGTQLIDQASLAETSEAGARVSDASRFGGGVVESALFEMLAEFRRIGCPIQAVNVGESRGHERTGRGAQGPDGLVIMARKTGGEFFQDSESFGSAMAAASESAGIAYLVTFEPRNPKMDGRYRRLEVTLKKPQSSLSLVHRPGYYETRSST